MREAGILKTTLIKVVKVKFLQLERQMSLNYANFSNQETDIKQSYLHFAKSPISLLTLSIYSSVINDTSSGLQITFASVGHFWKYSCLETN